MVIDENKRFNILIVDDISKNIQVLGNILREEGYTLSFSTSGEQALDMTASDAFDLILLDVMMPEMDGFDVCEQLKQHRDTRDVPVIFLTAKTDTDSIVKGFDLGAVDYVTKPFNARELLARVKTHLALKFANEELKKKNEEIRLLSITDPLTGCYNRGYIADRLDGEIRQAVKQGGSLSLILCDIDHFKSVNDTHGHQAGDQVLRQFVRHMMEAIRANIDWLARYGGEEFIMVLPDTSTKEAATLAEQLRISISEKHFRFETRTIRITSSFGVTGIGPESPVPDVSVDTLIKYSDQYLYAAKARGRNCVNSGPVQDTISIDKHLD